MTCPSITKLTFSQILNYSSYHVCARRCGATQSSQSFSNCTYGIVMKEDICDESIGEVTEKNESNGGVQLREVLFTKLISARCSLASV